MVTGRAGLDLLDEVAGLLGAEPGWAPHLRPGAAYLVLDGGGRLLAATPQAEEALGGAEVAATLPRLGELAAGAAPRTGQRLERLRLGRDRLAPPHTCACRLLRLARGEEVLVVALPGLGAPAAATLQGPAAAGSALGAAPPSSPPPTSPGEVAPGREDVGRSPPAPEEHRPAASPPPPHGADPVRFVWETDAAGRFVAVSGSLASLVGASHAAILGRTWAEIAGTHVHDPAGAVAAALARGETFSARRVLWRTEGGLALPVDLAGRPAGASGAYRGFGLCRVGEAAPPRPEAPSAVDPEPEDVTAGEDRPAAPGAARPTADPTSWASLFTALEGWTMALLGAPRPAAPRPEPVSPPVAAAELPHPPPDAPSAAPEAPPPASEASSAADGAAPPSPAEPRPLPHLSHHERDAFREIARALGARYEGDSPAPAAPLPPESPAPGAEAGPSAPPEPPAEVTRLLDRLPIGVLVHRGEEPLYANRALLDLTGHDSVGALAEAGGVGVLFPDRAAPGGPEGGAPVLLRDARRGSVAVDVRLAAAEWDGRPAGLMVVRRAPEAETAQRLREAELELRARDARLQEITSILDTAADGVIVLDEAGRILSLNRSAEALFGYNQNEVVGESLGVLLTPESRRVALDYLEGIRRGGVASVLNDGRDVVGRVAQGGSVPLQMTLGRVSESGEHRYCAVLRDATAARRLEAELAAAKRGAEAATRQRADVLARISHEVRTPLNAIMGFAEVMLEERGPDRAAGSSAALADRHADYLRDIRESGRHVIRVVDDLLDLARIEAGQMDMAFTGVPLTEVVMEAIAPLQAAAAARRVVIRTGLSPRLPPVVADARSLTQIVHNLVSNAIRFTEPGGQVIVSTALTETGGVVFRTRDTGVGMTAEEIEAALEPFRAAATARRGGVGLGTGLGLPLTRALVEANRGSLHIVSAKNQGTLVEVVFPPTRVLVE